MIQIHQLTKKEKRGRVIIEEIDLEIQEGEFVIVVGPSGAGKTTLLKLLIAEEKPTEGSIHFYGVNIHNLRKSDIPKYRQRIGVVFQDFRLLHYRTVFENISFVMEIFGFSREEIKENVDEILKLVSLEGKENYYPDELSQGERQRLAIARALVNQPDLLLVDEPVASLDEENRKIVLDLLKKIHELGTTVILFSHSADLKPLTAVRKIHLDSGKIQSDTKHS